MLRKLTAALCCALLLHSAVFAADDMKSPEATFIRDALVTQGIEKGLDKNPDLAARVEEFRKEQLALLALDAAQTEGMPDFTARAQELYQARKDTTYNLPLRLRVRVLEMPLPKDKVDEVKSKLTDIRAQIQAGKLDFPAAVLTYSTDPERKLTQGDSQLFAKGEKPDALYTAAEKLSAAQPLSDVILDQEKAYLLFFLARKEPQVQEFEAVKADIMAELQKEYRDDQRKIVLDKLHQQYQQQAGNATPTPQAAKM